MHDAAELTEGHSHDPAHSHVADADELTEGAHSHDHPHPALQAGLVEQLVDRFMTDENFVQRETTALRNRRFFEVMTGQVLQLAPKTVSYTDFERIVATGGADF